MLNLRGMYILKAMKPAYFLNTSTKVQMSIFIPYWLINGLSGSLAVNNFNHYFVHFLVWLKQMF